MHRRGHSGAMASIKNLKSRQNWDETQNLKEREPYSEKTNSAKQITSNSFK